MVSNLIQSLWIGDELSIMEQLCIRSFQKNGHVFHLYVYNEVMNIPSETVMHDANEILPASAIFKYKDQNSYAGFANWFRYKMLFEKGGWWVDTDTICIKQFDFIDDYVFMGQKHDTYPVANGLIKVPLGSPLMQACLEVCNQGNKNLYWGETGPVLLTNNVKKFNMMQFMKPPNFFAPIDWKDYEDFFKEELWKELPDETYSIHMWNEIWRRNNKDKNSKYPKSCLYERLKTIYL